MDRKIDGQKDRKIDGQKDRWTKRQMDRKLDEQRQIETILDVLAESSKQSLYISIEVYKSAAGTWAQS